MNPVRCVKISKDKKYVYSSGNDGSVKMWNLNSGLIIKAFRRLADKSVKNVALSANPNKIFYASQNVVLVDVETQIETGFSYCSKNLCAGYNKELQTHVVASDTGREVLVYYLPADFNIQIS